MPVGSADGAELLSTAEAARLLGLSADMVRLLARAGRLRVSARTPSGVRLFQRADVEALVAERRGQPDCDHAVQFYDHRDDLAEGVAGFLGTAMGTGAPAVIIATPVHRAAICKRLAAGGCDLAGARRAGRFVLLDAEETLAGFDSGGALDVHRFRKQIGAVLEQTRGGSAKRRPRLYGEMVQVLWRRGHHEAALELEDFWNDLARTRPFALLCAYAMSEFADASCTTAFERICTGHTRVIPTAQACQLEGDRRGLALLDQKARALDGEVARRKRAEQSLEKTRGVLRRAKARPGRKPW